MRLPSPTRPPLRALTASASQLTRETARRQKRARETWQQRAFAYYDLVPELHYAAQFYAKPLSRIRLFPADRDPVTGVVNPVEDPRVVSILDRIQDPGGGRSTLLTAYGQLMFITGECYLLGTVKDAEERWEVVSADELRVSEDGSVRRYRVPADEAQLLRPVEDKDFKLVEGSQVVAIRLWKRHPRFSEQADSPMRAILDIAEELVMLTLSIRARTTSRLSGSGSGILYVANGIGPPPLITGRDEDPNVDPLLTQLTEHVLAPIEDQGSPEAVTPLILRGPAMIEGVPAKEALFHLSLSDPKEAFHEMGLRTEAIRRLAIGLDFDPAELEGKASSNHWTGWLLQDERWQQHQGPVLQGLCDELGSVFLRPMARKEDVDGWERLTVGYDASAVLTNPDKSKDANEAFDRRAIGKKALREAKGFDDEDAPSQDELDEMLAVALRRPELVDAETGEPVDVPGEDDTVADVPGEPQAPDEGDTDQEPVVASALDLVAHRIAGAAEVAIERCRELAGSRIRSRRDSCPECLETVAGVPQGQVAAALGREMLAQLGFDTPHSLVAGGADALRERVAAWTGSRAKGQVVGDQVEQLAAATLFDETAAGWPLEEAA